MGRHQAFNSSIPCMTARKKHNADIQKKKKARNAQSCKEINFTPSGKVSKKFRKALASPFRPQVVIVECSDAGMEKPAIGQ